MGSTLDLRSLETYKESVLRVLTEQLRGYFGDLRKVTMKDILKKVSDINLYPRFSSLQNPDKSEILVMDEREGANAEKAVLSGRFFWEHAAAGEATRLGMGTKYLLKLNELSLKRIERLVQDEYVRDKVKGGMSEERAASEAAEQYSNEKLLTLMGCEPSDLAPLSLGNRHMLQMSYDVTKLARKHQKDPQSVLEKQKILIVLNEQTAEQILKDFRKHNFFGLRQNHVHFMVQKSFHGIGLDNGKLYYDKSNNKRLHNHGQMAMQKCHDKSIFSMSNGERHYLSFKEYADVLRKMSDMLSYNIEDIGYLTEAIDFASLGFALKLGSQGYDMVMEVVEQNQYRPQKGGVCFHDKELKRTVMVETNRLGNIDYKSINFLNKNFNHYPNPVRSFTRMRSKGLGLPFEVKAAPDGKHYTYPCPIQGDINFIVKCAYVRRLKIEPISNFKSPATLPPTIHAMYLQDQQDGFLEFADRIKGGCYSKKH